MIKSQQELEQTRRLLQGMEEAVADLMRSAGQMHPTQLSLELEGPMELVRRFRAEIDEYLGIRRAEELLSVRQ